MSGKHFVWKGAMGTGKTHSMLLEAEFRRRDTPHIYAVKCDPLREFRGAVIKARTGKSISGWYARDVSDLIFFVERRDIEIFVIDEVQFFGEEVIDIIARLLARGADVLAAGFDYWFDGKEDGVIKALAEMADTVYYCSARCEICNKARTKYSLRIDGSDEMVDTSAEYKAVCGGCYVQNVQR